jgi:hypothetical protein
MIITILGLIITLLILFINKYFKQTEWYCNQFEDAIKFKDIPSNLQVVNLGSNNAKYSLDYTNVEFNGMNWAVGPQSISFDYKILRTFIHKIKKGGSLIIVISPLHSVLDKFESKNANDKYYLFLPSKAIPNYKRQAHLKVWINKHFPLIFIIKNPKLIIHFIIRRPPPVSLFNNPMNEAELEGDAIKWIVGWKNQFKIENLEAPLSEKYLKIQEDNRKVLIDIIELCRSHKLNPVIVLPPLTQTLLKYLTPKIQQIYIYSFLVEVIQKTKVRLLDYMTDPRFFESDLYLNSFFLNQRGRKEFTHIVLKDVHSNIKLNQ